MRQRNDPNFSAFLDAIGDDYQHGSVKLGRLRYTQSTQELIDFVFLPRIVSNPGACIKRAILSPYIAFVDEFNLTILNTLSGNSHSYLGGDSIEEDLQSLKEAVFEDPEFLNSLQEPGIPPHELILKVGALC
jgi:hypothetical protein